MNNPMSGNAEWSLDTQISTEMAHDVKQLDIYDVGTFTDPEVARGINLFVSDDRASALSITQPQARSLRFAPHRGQSPRQSSRQSARLGSARISCSETNGARSI